MAEQTEVASSGSTPSANANEALKRPQAPVFSGFPGYPNGNIQMFPIVYPALVPNINPLQPHDQVNHGAGIYAVSVPPFTGPIAGLPSNTLIPLTYRIPTSQSTNVGTAGEQGQGGQLQQNQQQPGAPRQVVVRRFQIAFQLDLLLILKLAAVIFLFNQDGSRQRLVLLVFCASLVYLYQTGALTPLVRWLSQSMHRAAAPPRPNRAPVRAENAPGARLNENVAEGQDGAENENRPAEVGNQVDGNGNVAEPAGENGGNQWWGIVKEIQMIVFGFITSLLPGFHNVD